MGQVIGDLLPLAIGVAISPIPIIAVILMLLSRRSAATGTGFLIGWLVGIVLVTVVVLVLVGQAGNASDGKPSTVSSIIKLVLGALLLVMAGRQWQHRPKQGELARMPKWMSAIDSFTFAKAAGLGVLLSGANPKNLIMCLGAGTRPTPGLLVPGLACAAALSPSHRGVRTKPLWQRAKLSPRVQGRRATGLKSLASGSP